MPSVRAALFLLTLAAPLAAQGVLSTPFATRESPFPHTDGYYGYRMEPVGDVDGDGITDLVVGTPDQDLDGVNAPGLAEVISGADGSTIHTIRPPDLQPIGLFGRDVDGLGDVDGDGVPDLVVGASSVDDGLTDTGRAYVFSGADGRLLRTLASPAGQARAYFGFQVAGPGDLDGDDVPDVVVGAPDEDVQELGVDYADRGRVYAFSGADGALLWQATTDTRQAEVYFGRVNDAGGDLNGDGVPDLIASAIDENRGGSEDAGRVYALSGADGSVLYAVTARQPAAFAYFGEELNTVSDLTGDGVRELVISTANPTSVLVEGAISVFSGANGAWLGTYLAPESRQFQEFGQAVAEAGDLTGDGVPDVYVSAIFASYGADYDETGVVYLVDGTALAAQRTDAATRLAPLAVLLPPEPQDAAFGVDLADLRDADGDGVPDVAISATRYDGVRGRVFYYRGGPGPTAAEPAPGAALALRAGPNPSRGPLAVTFTVGEAGPVDLAVFDVTGRRVAGLVERAVAAGEHHVEAALDLPAGVYVVRLRAGATARTLPLTVVR